MRKMQSQLADTALGLLSFAHSGPAGQHVACTYATQSQLSAELEDKQRGNRFGHRF